MTRAFPHRPVATRFGEALMLAGAVGATAGLAVAFDARLYDDFTLPKQSLLLISTGAIVAGMAATSARPRLPTAALVLVGAWVAWLTLALLLGRDPRGGVLGLYQYRQGYLTQVAYVVLLLAASRVEPRQFRLVAWAGLAALTVAATYAAMQSLGADPIDWWIETGARPIGTIGNANELAAFALISLGWLGVTARGQRFHRSATVGIVALASFVAIDAQSKSALLALGVFAVLDPALRRLLLGSPALHRALLLLLGLGLGALLAIPTGGLSGLMNRVDAAADDPGGVASGGGTRLELWEGALSVAIENPVTGVGPDGLHLAFPEEASGSPRGDFVYRDLVAQSSHSWPLDVAANTGIAGLAILAGALAVLLRGTAARASAEADGARAAVLAASGAYLVVTFLNPLSLAAHALFFFLLGYGSRTGPAARPGPLVPALRWSATVIAGLAAAGLVTIAVLVYIADHRASHGWDTLASGEFETSARDYDRAYALMPFERAYASRGATAWLALAATDPNQPAAPALERYDRLRRHFPLTPTELGQVAVAAYDAGHPDAEVTAWLDRMLAADPHGHGARRLNSELRAALVTRAPLSFDFTDYLVHPGTRSP